MRRKTYRPEITGTSTSTLTEIFYRETKTLSSGSVEHN